MDLLTVNIWKIHSNLIVLMTNPSSALFSILYQPFLIMNHFPRQWKPNISLCRYRRFYLTFLCTNMGCKCLPNMVSLWIQFSFLQFYKQNIEYWTGTRVKNFLRKVKRGNVCGCFHPQLCVVCWIETKLTSISGQKSGGRGANYQL